MPCRDKSDSVPTCSRATIATVVIALAASWSASARAADPIKIGFSMPLTGSLASTGKAILTAYQMWEQDTNAKGGLHRPPGPARLLRRPEQSVAGARHLRQAVRRRQDRPRAVELRHQSDRAVAAGGDPAQARHHGAVRARHQRAVQLSLLLLDVPCRPRRGARVLARLLRDRQGAKARDGRDRQRRFRLRQEGGGRRARQRREDGLQDRLRAQLSAVDRSISRR